MMRFSRQWIWFTLNVVLYCCPHCTYTFRTARAWWTKGFGSATKWRTPRQINLRSAARSVDYLHRAFDVIPEVDATSALCEFSRMRREGQLYNSHEAFVNEVAMYAELRRARPRWGADKHEWRRWRQWAWRYRNEPFSAELGPHNAPPGARGTHYTFPAGSDNVYLGPSLGATRPRVLQRAQLMLTTCHTPHRLPHTIRRAPAGPLFKKEGMLLRRVA